MSTGQDDLNMWQVWLIMLITLAALLAFTFALWFILQHRTGGYWLFRALGAAIFFGCLFGGSKSPPDAPDRDGSKEAGV